MKSKIIINGIKTGMRYIKNIKFREWIDQFNKPTSLTFYEYGTQGWGKVIYLIGLEDLNGLETHMGFFALFNCVLNRLWYADRLGFIPIVNYPSTVLYYDAQHGNNVWEYYFKPVSGINYKDTAQAINLVISEEKDSQFNLQYKPGYLLDDNGICNLAKVWRKYVQFNESTQKYLECELNKVKKGKMLGVHVRGTDYNNRNKNHPVMITTEQYIERVKGIFKTGNYDSIFLATDEEMVIQKFIKSFGGGDLLH